MTVTRKPGNKTTLFCFGVVVLLTCFTRISAATLADYARRVSGAVAIIEQLQAAYDDEDPSLSEHFVVTNINRIREQLPAKELVLVNGRSVAVDNGWLHAALGDYEKTTSNQTKRAEMLVRIGERLRALDERLKEMQRGQPTNATDKDESKGRLAEILRRPEYNQSAVEGSAFQRLLDRILRWLLRLIPRSKPPQPGGSPFISKIAEVIVVLVCVAVVAFLIWKFGPRFLQDRRKKKKKRAARIVLGERLEPDQTSADLLAQAEALAGSGDLRAAIRKAYIALLCELGDRKIVSLAQHKTNRDYLNSVRERVSLHSSMRKLTNSFELHWYGFQPAGENDWIEFRNGYHQVLKMP
jgi:Domain of unknown function (DUF4129)